MTESGAVKLGALEVLFFASGFAAILYQLLWQRVLLALYGVHTESVTIVVTAFMVGLGLGSLFGGKLSARTERRLEIFAALEAAIGAFGLVSLGLFRAVALALAESPWWVNGLSVLALLIVPTFAMGATLPLLTAHAVAQTANVGRSVGFLYRVNTLGSAAACVLGAALLFPWLGVSGSLRCAVIVNLAIASVVMAHALRDRSRGGSA